MTTPPMEARFKDFSKKRVPIVFRIDNDDFQALSVLPVPVMQRLVSEASKLKDQEATETALADVLNIFNSVLYPDSAAKFQERVQSLDNPVDLNQVMDIMVWLMELYGQRPTQPSSDSSTGLPSGTDGTISVDGALPVA